MSSPKTIPPAEAAKQLAAKEARILDVRTPAEFEEMHVPGSVLAPLDSLSSDKLGSEFEADAPVLVMCRSGKRATAACEKIGSAFPNAQVIEGGIEAWAAAGNEVERGRKTMSLERQVRIAAGALVLIGSILAWQVSIGFIALPAFVGAGLMFAGITDTCGMGMMLAKMPWNQRKTGTAAKAALASS